MSARLNAKVVSITPAAASFATPYTSGDVIGAVNTISHAVLDGAGCSRLLSLAVLDKANQKVALDLIFFSEAPVNSIGVDNAAYALNDADLAKVLGRITVATGDYVSSGATNAEATLKNIMLLMESAPKSTDLFMAVIARGAPTYGSASDLIVRLGLEQY